MTPNPSPSGSPAPPRRTVADVRTHWRPGWIWAVPIAAVAIVVWLLVRAVSGRSTDVTLVFDSAHGMKANGTEVDLRGMKVGEVVELKLAKDARHVVADLSIDDDAKPFLRTGTRFYLQGATVSLSDPSSLTALIAGPTIVMVAGAGSPARHFTAIEGNPPTMTGPSVRYLIDLDADAVGDLHVGAPVKLRGFTIGEVADVTLRYDAATGQLSTPVTVALDPTRFHMAGVTPPADGQWAPVMDATLAHLVDNGWRADLTRNPPVVGGAEITLERIPGLAPATLVAAGPLLEIPSAPGGGGLNTLVARLGKVPIERIGENVLAITGHVRSLVASPSLRSTLDHLDGTVASLDSTVHAIGPDVRPAIRKMARTADEIDATAVTVRRIAGGSLGSSSGNLESAVHEMTEAARAIRTLANYLDQHPEALVAGRSR